VKERIWAKDWFAALAYALGFAILAYGVFSTGFQGLELAAYDMGVRGHDRPPSDRIAIVAIGLFFVAGLVLLRGVRAGGPTHVAPHAGRGGG